MDWLASATSLIMIWLMGNKSKWGPVMGLVSQLAWGAYALSAEAWGLAPAVIGFTIVHTRNLIKWMKE
jgi:hypothetical protein